MSLTAPVFVSGLRKVLDDAGFAEQGILETLGLSSYSLLQRSYLPLLLHRIGESPLATLVRIFIVGAPVSIDSAKEALAPLLLDDLVAGGLLSVDDAVQGQIRLRAERGLLVANDIPKRDSGALRPDHVMGMSPSSLLLADLTVRVPCEDTLDLGTGSGVLALMTAEHSSRVVATDLNERAVAFAQFNAALNEISNVECLAGSLFEPLEGRTFDLIVSNPPYVLSPDARFQFMDSDLGGEEFCKQLVSSAPAFLTEGGWCQVTCNWGNRPGLDWKVQLEEWFEGTGCDAWALRIETTDAASYATGWIQQGQGADEKLYEERFPNWMRYFETEGIDGVSLGVISMRRSGKDKNWIRIEDAPGSPVGLAGDHVLRVFESQDFLETADTDRLMELAPQIADHVRLEQVWETRDGRLSDAGMNVAVTKGLPYWGHIDPHGAGVLASCDGRRTLRELLNEMAAEIDVPLAEIADEATVAVRNLLQTGILEMGGKH